MVEFGAIGYNVVKKIEDTSSVRNLAGYGPNLLRRGPNLVLFLRYDERLRRQARGFEPVAERNASRKCAMDE